MCSAIASGAVLIFLLVFIDILISHMLKVVVHIYTEIHVYINYKTKYKTDRLIVKGLTSGRQMTKCDVYPCRHIKRFN